MQRDAYARIAFVVVLLIVGYYVFRILTPFLTGLIWAAILATVFHPAFATLARRLKHPRLASALACLLLTVAIVLPVIVLLILLAGQSVDAYRLLRPRLRAGNWAASIRCARRSPTSGCGRSSWRSASLSPTCGK